MPATAEAPKRTVHAADHQRKPRPSLKDLILEELGKDPKKLEELASAVGSVSTREFVDALWELTDTGLVYLDKDMKVALRRRP